MRKKKYQPAGAEFDGKCRQIENVAQNANVAFSEIRLADYVFHNGQQWTVRTVFEQRIGSDWIEIEWCPVTHSISVPKQRDASEDPVE